GLALAVDYSLLMVNRFREARAAGAEVPGAVEFTAATAGRTVTFSALTVAAALSGLFAFGDPTFTSVAVGGIATVLVALAAPVPLPMPMAVAVDARLVRCILVPAPMTRLGSANWGAPAPLHRLHQRLGLHEAPAHPASLTGSPVVGSPAIVGQSG